LAQFPAFLSPVTFSATFQLSYPVGRYLSILSRKLKVERKTSKKSALQTIVPPSTISTLSTCRVPGQAQSGKDPQFRDGAGHAVEIRVMVEKEEFIFDGGLGDQSVDKGLL
jgi:hypothetical protein